MIRPKVFIINILVLLSFLTMPMAASCQTYNNPESIVFDFQNQRWLISNKSGSNILQLDLNGNLDFFVSGGLNNPKGIIIVNDVLYVNENTAVKGFALSSGTEVFNLFIPGAAFLNDIETDNNGNLFLSGSNSSKIYKVNIANITYSVFAEVSASPNGLLSDVNNNRLLLCYFTGNSPIDAINLSDSSVTTVVNTTLTNLDGMARDNNGNIYVSSWGSNAVYSFDPDFINPPEMVVDGLNGPADIYIEKNSGILAIPNFNADNVVFKVASSGGNLINVPADQPSIQAGIETSDNGDLVLVAPGTYYENINFIGKNIRLSSRYIFDFNTGMIFNTEINGSNPIYPDTASCVLFINGEDSTAILEGFYITEGTGTKWIDEHGAGLFYEGGGILIQYSSPTIRNNMIIFNEAINTTGAVSAGGGAIRCGDSNPVIQNNVIAFNQARYGGGIVLNFSGAIIRNNIIDHNFGGEDYGGGGIWSYGNGAEPIIIENNTITANHSELGGGGIRLWSSNAELTNNIFWDNTANSNPQIQGNSGTVTYCNVEGGWSGVGNIDEDPLFAGENMYLTPDSPCVDAGNPETDYNDPEDPENPGQAEWPSLGELRNDMGAYGGPFRNILADYVVGVEEYNKAETGFIDFKVYPNPFTNSIKICITGLDTDSEIIISDLYGKVFNRISVSKDVHTLDLNTEGLPAGIYLCTLKTVKGKVCCKNIKL